MLVYCDRSRVLRGIFLLLLIPVMMNLRGFADDCDVAPALSARLPEYTDPAAKLQSLPTNTQFDVLTQHNNNSRTGALYHENILTPASVAADNFGYLGSVSVSGKIYAQPLYVEKAAVECELAGRRALTNANIAYIATLENFVYAIDTDRRQVCWKS